MPQQTKIDPTLLAMVLLNKDTQIMAMSERIAQLEKELAATKKPAQD